MIVSMIVDSNTGGPRLTRILAQRKTRASKILQVKLPKSSFVKLHACEILSPCYPRNGLYLKNCASEIRTSKIRARQGPPVESIVPLYYIDIN